MTGLIQVDSFEKSALLNKYKLKPSVFPLIMAVLNGAQEGKVYSYPPSNNYFVIHKFGFADLIETEANYEFDLNLYKFFSERKFPVQKIRWYDVPKQWLMRFENTTEIKFELSERVQLICNNVINIDEYYPPNISAQFVTGLNYDLVHRHFNLSLESRFWSSKQQFLDSGMGIVIFKNKTPAAICYACALVDNLAEVDVFTKETFRSQGLGRMAVAAFINHCTAKNIKVHWDCYTNNQASYALAKSVCFEPYHIYPHVILSR